MKPSHTIRFDVDLATELMGFTASAYLWLTVEPASLAVVGEQIAAPRQAPRPGAGRYGTGARPPAVSR